MTEVIKDFKWKDKNNNYYNVKDMTTKHLFFTFKMIWNHTVPDELKILPYIRYNFGSFYSTEYMSLAVRLIFEELKTRQDIDEEIISCIDLIHTKSTELRLRLLYDNH